MSTMQLRRPTSATTPMTTPPTDAFAHFVSDLRAIVPLDDVVLLSTMPRGGLRVCRRLHLNDSIVRRYNTELHAHDKCAWRVLRETAIGPGSDGECPIAHGLAVTLGVRIESPIFDGYPGLVLVLRRSTQSAPPVQLSRAAAAVREAFDQNLRAHRSIEDTMPRQFIFAEGKVIFPNDGLSRLEPKLAAALTAAAEPRMAADFSGDALSGRIGMPDASGVHVPAEIVRFESYPALAEGPVVFVSLHPRVQDWQKVQPDDFAADPELARLTAAVNFMVTTYRRGPTLEEVADAVHLSQFHFHRRFSDIFGLTPKHLLYDLQLHEAQRMLSEPGAQLADIAKHCGFAHQSHFSSRFKQGTGMTPSRWRRHVVTFHDA